MLCVYSMCVDCAVEEGIRIKEVNARVGEHQTGNSL